VRRTGSLDASHVASQAVSSAAKLARTLTPLVLAWCAIVSHACGGDGVTEVLVRVSADDAVRARATFLRVRVRDTEGEVVRDQTEALGDDALRFPATIPLTPRDGERGRAWEVEVEAFESATAPGDDDVGFVLRRVGGRYVVGRSVEVPVRLDLSCGDVRCPAGQTCAEGLCVGACVEAAAEDGVAICSECEVCESGACVPRDELACGCPGDRCTAGVCLIDARHQVELVGAGLDATCVTSRRDDATELFCFGRNADGELGLDEGPAQVTAPTSVTRASGFFDVDVGGFRVVDQVAYGCAVTRDEELRCWGRTGSGRVGAVDLAVPTALFTEDDVREIATGGSHTCARTASRELFCIGRSVEGQLGRGPDPGAGDARVAVAHPRGGAWAQVDVGHTHSCAVDDAGEIYCWGHNETGQLGIAGDFVDRDAPVRVELEGRRFRAVTAGAFHTCALDVDGDAWCWGGAGAGNLGGPTVADSAGPGLVSVDEALNSVSCGRSHCCAITRADGALHCWGRNESAQLGLGVATDFEPLPQRVGRRSTWASYAGGERHGCALRSDRALFCWGDNSEGQLGLGDTRARTVPTRVCLP